MKLKKQKRHRRAVRFYTTCFGFRQPFKVLCDGTFVHQLLVNNIIPADSALSNLLGGTVKLFTTSCVLAELKRLSDENRKKDKKIIGDENRRREKESLDDPYFESFTAARNLTIARCDHEKRIQAADCVMEIIGENNSEHFFVATQDTDLRRKFQEIPAVPLIFGVRNALFIEPPSASQRQFVKSTEEERLHMTEREYKMLDKKLQERLAAEEASDEDAKETSDANGETSGATEDLRGKILGTQDVTKMKIGRNRMTVKDKPQFKRKKAKGPNPLSCKKKSQGNPTRVSEKEGKAGDETLRSRSRNRKRGRRRKNATEADS